MNSGQWAVDKQAQVLCLYAGGWGWLIPTPRFSTSSYLYRDIVGGYFGSAVVA